MYLKYIQWSQRDKYMYNEVLNLIRVGIELLNQFLKKKKKGVVLRGKNGINLRENSIFKRSLVLFKSL